MNAPGQVPAANEEESFAPPGPGGLLRSARESAGISLRDISAQLHLDERTVDSLERDDFDTLPAPTFVRGYLRGYARLLSVPVGPVLEAYDREGFRPPDLVADISEEPENAASDFPVKLVTWAVVIILLAMVVVWWNNNNPELGDLLGPGAVDSQPSNDDTFTSSAELSGNNDINAQQPATGATDELREPAATAAPEPDAMTVQTSAANTTDTQPAAPELSTETPTDVADRAEQVLAQAEQVLTQSRQAIEASSGSNTDNAPTASDSAQGNATSGQSQSADAASASSPTASANADSGTQGPADANPEMHLVVTFTEEAWVQIVDREEKKLFYNLAKPGQTIDLRGQPPLRVILGRTRGVEVLVDGKRFDVSPHVSKGVARFSVP